MRAALEAGAIDIDEPEVRLVYERRAAQRVVGPLPVEVAAGQAHELVVYERDQAVEGVPVAGSPMLE